MLFDLLVARAVYTLHAIIEDIIEFLYCLLFHAFFFTEIGLRNVLVGIDDMIKLATVSYLYLYSCNIESTFVFFTVHKVILVIDVHKIDMNVLIDPILALLLIG